MTDRESRKADRRGTVQTIPPYLPRKEGVLQKRLGSAQKVFRDRFFEIDAFTDSLWFYTDNPLLGPSKSKLRGCINLSEARIEAGSSSSNKPKIAIRTASGKKFDLTARDNVDRDSWIHALCAARDTPFDEQQNRKDWSKHKDGSICLDAIGESDALEEAMKADYSYDLDEAGDVQDLFTLTLRDLNGVDSRMGDIMSNRLNLVLLCGQFGSPTTKRLLADLMRHIDFFEDLGVQVMVVGTCNPIAMGIFRKDNGYPPIFYSDSEKKLYRELGCRRGFRWAFSSQAFAAMQDAVSLGHRASQGVGDALQIGGLFLISKEDGVVYQHIEKYAGNIPDSAEVLSSVSNHVRKNPHIWATPPVVQWNEILSLAGSKVTHFNVADRAWHAERGFSDASSFNTSTGYLLTDSDNFWYRKQYHGMEHQLWVTDMPGETDDGETKFNEMAIIAVNQEINRDKKLMIFHASGLYRRYIPAFKAAASEKEAIEATLARITGAPDLEVKKVDCVMPPASLQDELVKYEQLQAVRNYKIGLLYCRDGQVDESEIYANPESATSPGYEEFLQFIGNRIPLKGWTGYRGGLDVKKEVSGTHSICAAIDDVNIMFHVATMIPIDKEPEQALLERKRHIGNDVVVLIFKEGNQQLDPSTWRSQFNHVFVVVSKDERRSQKEDGKTFYRIEVLAKPQAPVCLPVLPDPPVFEKGKEFHKFLLTKLVNSERATTRAAPVFKQKMEKMRGMMLRDLVQLVNNDPNVVRLAPPAVGTSGRAKVKKSKSDISSNSPAITTASNSRASQMISGSPRLQASIEAPAASPSPTVSFASTADHGRAGSASSVKKDKEKRNRSLSRDSSTEKGSAVVTTPTVAEKVPKPAPTAAPSSKEDIFSLLEADILKLDDSEKEPVASKPSPSAEKEKPEKHRDRASTGKGSRTRTDSNRSDSTSSATRPREGREGRRPPSRSTSGEGRSGSKIKATHSIEETTKGSPDATRVEEATAVSAAPAVQTIPEEPTRPAQTEVTPAEPAQPAQPAEAESGSKAPEATGTAAPMTPLEESLQKLVAVENQVRAKAVQRHGRTTSSGSSGPSPAIVRSPSSTSASASSEIRHAAALDPNKKGKSFAELQAQWRSLAAGSINQTQHRVVKTHITAPAVAEADELFSVVKEVLSQLQPTDKRVVVTNAKDPADKDLVAIKQDIVTAADLAKAIEASTGRKVESVSFQGVPVRDKHISMFNDKDIVEVVYS